MSEAWRDAVVYQVYPRSFDDSDGDGVGDLHGVLERLDYLEDLGIDVVWLNPIYESPAADAGYDVRDYRAVDPTFGTMADLEALVEGLHDRGIRLLMDLVVNHTSDEHEWFQRSRRGDPEYADFYHWVDGEPDEPPNNWESAFGGPAWSYEDERGAWYLHLFHEKQPDLDWQQPAVREVVYDMMGWWFEKGVDGFRMDVINLLSKPDGYPDGDPGRGWVGLEHFADGPRIHQYLDEMHRRVLEPYDAMTVGECVEVDVATANDYVGPDGPLDLIFHFDHVRLDFHPEAGWWEVADWDLRELKGVFDRWAAELEGRNAIYLGNHDQPRIVSRFGDERYRRKSAKLLGTFLLTMAGTPFWYQGDELGMTNYPWSSLSELEDAESANNVRLAMASGEVDDFEEIEELVRYRSRDNARTPMQWDDSENAGFTSGDPWLPVNPDCEEVNAAAARADPHSVLNHYRRLVDIRDSHRPLVDGRYVPLTPEHPEVWAYDRVGDDERFRVVLNWSSDGPTLPDSVDVDGAEPIIDNYLDDDTGQDATGSAAERSASVTSLRPWEACVYRRS